MDKAAVDESLLVSCTYKSAGAGFARRTGKGTESPGATVKGAGRMMPAGALTVIFAVASASVKALARIMADPGATPVTATVAVVVFSGIVTVAEGTVATPVLLELMLRVRPPGGAGPDRVSVRFWLDVPTSVKVSGEKLTR